MLVIDNQGKHRIHYPDFYLPQHGIIIEYFGLYGKDRDYTKGAEKKKQIYKNMDIPLIPIYPTTLNKNWQTYLLATIRQTVSNRGKNHNYYKPRTIY